MRDNRRLSKRTAKIGEPVDAFALVCYEPLDVGDGESVAKPVPGAPALVSRFRSRSACFCRKRHLSPQRGGALG